MPPHNGRQCQHIYITVWRQQLTLYTKIQSQYSHLKQAIAKTKAEGLIGVGAITLWIIHNLLWKYLYNWLCSMAAINSCPPLSGLNDLVRGHTSPHALYEINTTSPLELNRPTAPFVHEVWCKGIIISFPGSEGSNLSITPSRSAALQCEAKAPHRSIFFSHLC